MDHSSEKPIPHDHPARANIGGATFGSRLRMIAYKEFIHVRRDPIMPRLIILLPILVLILFGYALNTTVKNVPLAVFDASQDRISKAIVKAFSSEERFSPVVVDSSQAALEAVRTGVARAVLEIPKGALAAARKNEALELTFRVDGSDPNMTAQMGVFAADSIKEVSERLLAGRALTNSSFSMPLSVTQDVLYNPDKRTAVFMVPGIIGLVLSLITVLLTAVAVVREREVGTMESLIATPVRPLEVVIGKVIPYFGFGLLDAALVLGVGVWLFKVPMNGDVWLLVLASILFVLGSLGIGVVISTLARNQMQAMFATLAFVFPNMFLSGMLFPLEGMNPFFQGISYVIPLRYFLKVTRGVMLRGAGLENLSLEFIALTVFAVLMLLVASLRFKKTL